ncbi:DNA-directed RNA polymerase subunit H [Methanoregula sp.]|uniref:DNA-directed RNA polymerase subunit H n=1 Tax=Methanoregula sp. TaxID=2052170 RepID=UPI002608A928|nr:DNA-directed RNA polymerase subunit H [Methanoregula sp.]MDD5142999.1 DNA-directed RNA polymerase subunit H [Methanoregula sp.]
MSTKLNVIEHVMVPDHQIMSEDEVSELLSRYNITTEQLPKIYHDDPAVKMIGAEADDVIRIIRTSHTAGRAEAYRLVIRKPKK